MQLNAHGITLTVKKRHTSTKLTVHPICYTLILFLFLFFPYHRPLRIFSSYACSSQLILTHDIIVRTSLRSIKRFSPNWDALVQRLRSRSNRIRKTPRRTSSKVSEITRQPSKYNNQQILTIFHRYQTLSIVT